MSYTPMVGDTVAMQDTYKDKPRVFEGFVWIMSGDRIWFTSSEKLLIYTIDHTNFEMLNDVVNKLDGMGYKQPFLTKLDGDDKNSRVLIGCRIVITEKMLLI